MWSPVSPPIRAPSPRPRPGEAREISRPGATPPPRRPPPARPPPLAPRAGPAAPMRPAPPPLPPAPTTRDDPPPADPGVIPLSVAEVKRLYNLLSRTLHATAHHLRWTGGDAATKPVPAGTTNAHDS